MITRKLTNQLKKSLEAKKSILLIGPRQVGKSTLIKSLRPQCEFNLSNQSEFIEFAKDPKYLESKLNALSRPGGIIFIDEVQRIPTLLNTVQYLIDKKVGYQFVLTGSSARKLRRGRANLLPGRVHSYQLGPIVSCEMEYALDTQQSLKFGCLPEVVQEFDLRNSKKLLKSYSMDYLNEEIKAEALTKNLEGFTRFLFRLAADTSKFLDLTKVGKNAGVPRQTVQRFFEILEDTLLVNRLEAYAKSDKRRLIQHPKFYFFDNGVLNSLLNNFNCSLDRQGMLFENFFFNQLSLSLSYSELDYRLSSYRTDSGAEVDIILELQEQIYALEVKSAEVKNSELGGLKSFEKFVGKKVIKKVITMNEQSRKVDDIEFINWQKFLKNLKI